MRHDEQPWPWRVADLVSVTATDLVGLALILSGYYVVAHTADPGRQLLGVNLSVGGLIIALVANAVWLLSGVREVGLLRRELLSRRPLLEGSSRRVDGEQRPAAALDHLVSAPTMTLYHRPSCPAVQGKHVIAEGLSSHHKRGRKECTLCLPHAQATTEAVPR